MTERPAGVKMISPTSKSLRARLVLSHLALLLANSILGIGSVVSKMGLTGTNPVVFALVRELVAAPLLYVMSRMVERDLEPSIKNFALNQQQPSRRTPLRMQDIFLFLLAGFMLFGTNLGYIVGVKILGATSAAIWQSSLPIFTMIMAALFGYEKLSWLKVMGVLFAFSGCAFITLYDTAKSTGASSDSQLAGNLVFLFQVVACAGFFVAEKPLLKRFSPLVTLAYSYAIASTLMLIVGVTVNSTRPLLDIVCPDCHGDGWSVPVAGALAIAYWVFLGSICGYYLITWGNQMVDASMVGIYFTVQPVAAVLAAMTVIFCAPDYASQIGLHGLSMSDMGALGIFAGVGVLIYDAKSSALEATASLHSSPRHSFASVSTKVGASPSFDGVLPSTSHDNVLLAMRIAAAAQIRPDASTDMLPSLPKSPKSPLAQYSPPKPARDLLLP